MWECPKCGRTFKNTNQAHYCGSAPATIEEYIERQPEKAQPYLRQINCVIKAALPLQAGLRSIKPVRELYSFLTISHCRWD